MKKISILAPLLPVLAILAAWQAFVAGDAQRLFFFGSPLQIALVAVEELPKKELWIDIGMTVSALLAGLVCGTLLGTGAGLLLSLNGAVRRACKPTLLFLSSIQIFTIAPLLIIWFGIGWEAKVALATLATCFVALHQVSSGIQAAEEKYQAYARSLGADPLRILWRITLPGALHWVLAGFKLNISFAVLGTLIGEFISAEQGLGHYIFRASGLYDVPRVWFGVILLCLIVVGLTELVDRIARRS